MSSAPLIADVTIDGTPRKVVAVPSKQAWLYVFDRVTGEPIWPIEEKPVPKGDVPGEWYAPTQPHPPAALMYGAQCPQRTGRPDRLHAGAARAGDEEASSATVDTGVVYNPPMVGNVNGLLGAINMGDANGGTNWPGGGYDPETHTVFAQAATASIAAESLRRRRRDFPTRRIRRASSVRRSGCARRRAPAPMRTRRSGRQDAAPTAPAARAVSHRVAALRRQRRHAALGARAARAGLTVQGLSIVKPPYGVLAAIDLDKGASSGGRRTAIRRMTCAIIRCSKGMNIPKTGQSGSVGLVITKTLVILGDPQFTTTSDHPRGAMLRAYDKATGKEVGAVFMPAPQSGSPMTYMVDGRQYIVVAVSGGPYSGEYICIQLATRSHR